VIVNKADAQSAITSHDLRSVLLGEKEKWPDGNKVMAVLPTADHPETSFLLKAICGMSTADFKRYFMQLSFQGKTVALPRMLPSPASIKALVASTPGAVGIIPASSVDASVNQISLDGRSPGAAGYKLTE
jgi:hypothetical protein